MSRIASVSISVFAVVAVLSLGFFIGKTIQQGTQISLLREEVASVNSQSAGTLPKFGVVRVDELLTRYQEEVSGVADQLQREWSRIQDEIISISARVENEEISEADGNQMIFELQQNWNSFGLDLIARPLQNAVNLIAEEQDFDVIFKAEDVVLFAQNDALINLTDQVWREMR